MLSEQKSECGCQGNTQPHHGYRHGIIDRRFEHFLRPLPSPAWQVTIGRKVPRTVRGCSGPLKNTTPIAPICTAALLVRRLRRRGFVNMSFAAGLALEGIEIGQSPKPQRFANKPHRLGAADTTRPRQHRLTLHRLASTLAQHEQSSGSVIDLPPQARPRRASTGSAIVSASPCKC